MRDVCHYTFSMHEGSVSRYHVNPGQGRTMKVKEAEPWKLFKRWIIIVGSIGFPKWAMIVSRAFPEQEAIVIRSLWKEG